jgi:hypothetical protein
MRQRLLNEVIVVGCLAMAASNCSNDDNPAGSLRVLLPSEFVATESGTAVVLASFAQIFDTTNGLPTFGFADTLTIQVMGDTLLRGERAIKEIITRTRGGAVPRFTIVNDDNARVYSSTTDNTVFISIQAPIRIGTEWLSNPDDGPSANFLDIRKIESLDASLTLPAGRFTDVMRISSRATSSGQLVGTGELHYAKGVGIIRSGFISMTRSGKKTQSSDFTALRVQRATSTIALRALANKSPKKQEIMPDPQNAWFGATH